MNITDLILRLAELAENDLVEGADIFDHPCSVAVRALNGCMEDIDILRARTDPRGASKKVQILIKMPYTPEF